jgi:heptosyltransferase I
MEPERILIVRLGAFGDILHVLPAAATVRASCPRAKITWLVEPRWTSLLAGNPDIDEVIELDRRQLRQSLSATLALRRKRFDLAIDFQGLLKAALPTRLSGARVIVGLSRDAAREPFASLFYSRTFTPTARHIVDRHLELACAAAGGERVVRFAIPEGSPEGELPERYVLACPLAGWRSKQWPIERYAQLAVLVRDRWGVPLVLNGSRDARWRWWDSIAARCTWRRRWASRVWHCSARLTRRATVPMAGRWRCCAIRLR